MSVGNVQWETSQKEKLGQQILWCKEAMVHLSYLKKSVHPGSRGDGEWTSTQLSKSMVTKLKWEMRGL